MGRFDFAVRKMAGGSMHGTARVATSRGKHQQEVVPVPPSFHLSVAGGYITSADLDVPLGSGNAGDRLKTVFVSSRTFTGTSPALTTDDVQTATDTAGPTVFTQTVAHAIRGSSDTDVIWSGMSTSSPAYHIGIVADSTTAGSPTVYDLTSSTDPSLTFPSPHYGSAHSFRFTPPARALVVVWSGGGIEYDGIASLLAFPSIGGANERLIAWDSIDTTPLDVHASNVAYDGPRFLTWWPI